MNPNKFEFIKYVVASVILCWVAYALFQTFLSNFNN